MNIDELRARMAQANVTGSGLYIGNGLHVLELVLAKYQSTPIQGQANKESAIFEFKVHKSSAADHEVGQTRSYVENLANFGSFNRIKACLYALCGLNPGTDITPENEELTINKWLAICNDDKRVALELPVNFFAGTFVTCEGTPGMSKGNPAQNKPRVPVTNKKWLPAKAPVAP